MPRDVAKMGVVVLILVIAGALAGVAGACNNTRTNDHQHYFAGNGYPTVQGTVCVFGTDAFIYVTNPSVLAPDWSYWSESSAWTGLQFNAANGSSILSQTGWYKRYNGSRENWVGFNTGGYNFDETDWTAPAIGSEPEYKVTYTYANHTFHYFYNGANNYNVQYPTQPGCDYNTSAESLGEINTLHNQMPGTQSNMQQFDDEEVMNNGGTWSYPTGPGNWNAYNSNNTYFYLAQGAVSTFGSFTAEYANIYDKCNG